MAVLLIHHDPPTLAAWHSLLATRGIECLAALGHDSARLIIEAQREPGSREVTAVVAGGESVEIANELRAALGAVPTVWLAEPTQLPEVRERWADEWVLPDSPLPVDVLEAWLKGDDSGGGARLKEDSEASAAAVSTETGFARVSTHTGPVPFESSTRHLGDYELLELIEETDKTVVYRAWQHSVQRVVTLERLKTAFISDPVEVAAFRAQVRAQAAAVHPLIAAVYEAQEQEGLIFYTREWLEAPRLTEIPGNGLGVNEEAALSVLHAATQVANYLAQVGLARALLTPDQVRLAADGTSRVANLAQGGDPIEHPERAEIRALLKAVHASLLPGVEAPRLSVLEAKMKEKSGRHRIAGWQQFAVALADVTAVAPEVPRRRPSSRRPYHARRWLLAVGLVLVGFAALVWERWPYWQAPEAQILDEMVRIPGGEFIYQQGEKRELPAFWIDKYEVSLAHYEEFLQYCRMHPNDVPRHPRQPMTKTSHEPRDWSERLEAARRGEPHRGVQLDLNCPVTGVDFWDAWSYAAWKGRRLPTEVEWEKAARGKEGFLYPWGNKLASSQANVATDERAKMKSRSVGPVAVTAFAATDVSPFGVTNMAGNVAEWTASTTFHPELIDEDVPLVRGGSFETKAMPLYARRPAIGYEEVSPSLGFRTASDHAP